MSNLQNLIERIVESKVTSVLEENARRTARRKAKRERERKEGRAEILGNEGHYHEYAELSPEERANWAVRRGRDLNIRPAEPTKGRYGKNTSRKRSRDWIKSLGKPKVDGPKGDLP